MKGRMREIDIFQQRNNSNAEINPEPKTITNN